MLRFNADLYRIAMLATSTEETRYYLQGVFVEPHAKGGATLTATDGLILFSVWDPTGVADESAIVRLPTVLAKECKAKRDRARRITVDGNTATVFEDYVKDDDNPQPVASAHGCRIDGTYPDWRRIVKSVARDACDAPDTRAAYSSALLTRIGKIGDELAAIASPFTRKPAAPTWIRGPHSGIAALVRWVCYPDAFGFLMPMQAPLMPLLPDWTADMMPTPAAATELTPA